MARVNVEEVLERLRADVASYDHSSAKRITSKPRNIKHSNLLELLSYDTGSGKLVWKQGQRQGSEAGHYCTTRGKSYIRVNVNYELIMAHVLIWFYVYGEWPSSEIDHKNGNGRDNRLDNLRLSDRLRNNSNTTRRKDSLEHPNVNKTRNGKYQTLVKFNSKIYLLGTFDTVEEAIKVRDRAQALIPRFESHSAEPVAVSVIDKPTVQVPYRYLEPDIRLDNITIIDNIEVPPTAETI